MKVFASIFIATAALCGCAFSVTLMPRDSGKTYTGEMVGNGTGSGTMTVKLDGDETCTGPVARVASNETFGFANTYATVRGKPVNAFTTMATTGDVSLKAIMSCTSGKGLRCDLTGRGGGGGICVDDTGKIYDALAIAK